MRGELTPLHRRILAALITIDVHARDIVADLVQRGTKDANEFEWQMQLRYYFEGEDVVVRQVRGVRGGGGGGDSVAAAGRKCIRDVSADVPASRMWLGTA